jgi:hypothetical protein
LLKYFQILHYNIWHYVLCGKKKTKLIPFIYHENCIRYSIFNCNA